MPVDSVLPAGGVTRCSIVAAGADGLTGGASGVLRDGFVPRPRDGDADDGRDGAEGASRSERSGLSDRSDGGAGEGFVRLQQPPTVQDRTVPVLQAAQEELRTVVNRRPAPSRRLRRMHPQPAVAAVRPVVPTPRTGEEPDASAARAATTEAPLGVLIGGTPQPPDASGRPGWPGHPEERPTVRATAEIVRLGRGTCMVVLPAWRPAIAVSVPTERLLNATGLAYEQLADARLSVVINPGALHDRELDLRDWQAAPPGRVGRRDGRRSL
ncbi:hypothetical protein ACFP3U_32355 [Kitasatospora misakiensis]|uniref:Uncharacterized protein n=1 Tax=Kitasatospora misakiensis TaxID=67330 RepID=A0ABW0XAW2_9ACTN